MSATLEFTCTKVGLNIWVVCIKWQSQWLCTKLSFESDDIYLQRNTGNKCFKSNTALKYSRWPDYGSLCMFKTPKVWTLQLLLVTFCRPYATSIGKPRPILIEYEYGKTWLSTVSDSNSRCKQLRSTERSLRQQLPPWSA